jgi:hypothetical protein
MAAIEERIDREVRPELEQPLCDGQSPDACTGLLDPARANYQREARKTERMLDLIADFQAVPQEVDLPDIEVCLKGEDATIKGLSRLRSGIDTLLEIANFVTIPAGTTLTAQTWFVGTAWRVASSARDENMTAEEAITFYREYSELKRQLDPERLIGLRSCAEKGLRDRLATQALWLDRFHEDMNAVGKADACRGSATLERDLAGLRSRHEALKARVSAAAESSPGYTPVYDECPE